VPAKAVEARHESWKERLPKSEADLWEALTALDGTAQASLFAHCASFAVNAVYEPANRTNQGRVSAARRSHSISNRPMSWRAPSGSTWSKPGGDQPSTTISAVSTKPAHSGGRSRSQRRCVAQLIDHLKKADMAKEAERFLDGSGWLPESDASRRYRAGGGRAGWRSRIAARISH